MFKKSLFMLAAVAMIGLVSCKPKANDTNGDDNGNGNGNGSTYSLTVTNIEIENAEAAEEGESSAAITLKVKGTTITDEVNFPDPENVEEIIGMSMYLIGAKMTGGEGATLDAISLTEWANVMEMTLANGVDGTIEVLASVEALGLYWEEAITAGGSVALTLHKVTFSGNETDGYTVAVETLTGEGTTATSTITVKE